MTEKEKQDARDEILITMGKLVLDLYEKYIKKEEFGFALEVYENRESKLWDALVKLDNHRYLYKD